MVGSRAACWPSQGGHPLPWQEATTLSERLARGHDPSTATASLRRHDRLGAPAPWQRFETDAPNALWQRDV